MRTRGIRAMLRNRRLRHDIYYHSWFWDALAEESGAEATGGWPNQALNAIQHKRAIKLLIAHLPELDGRNILDIGCGTGRVARALAARGASVVGIDFSERTIEYARQSTVAENPKFE